MKYRLSYETTTCHTKEHFLLRVAAQTKEMQNYLKLLGLPKIESPMVHIHDIILETDLEPTISSIKQYLKEWDPGYVRFSSWDQV